MSKPIRSYPEAMRRAVALRRVKSGVKGGLGTLSAERWLVRAGAKPEVSAEKQTE